MLLFISLLSEGRLAVWKEEQEIAINMENQDGKIDLLRLPSTIPSTGGSSKGLTSRGSELENKPSFPFDLAPENLINHQCCKKSMKSQAHCPRLSLRMLRGFHELSTLQQQPPCSLALGASTTRGKGPVYLFILLCIIPKYKA